MENSAVHYTVFTDSGYYTTAFERKGVKTLKDLINFVVKKERLTPVLWTEETTQTYGGSKSSTQLKAEALAKDRRIALVDGEYTPTGMSLGELLRYKLENGESTQASEEDLKIYSNIAGNYNAEAKQETKEPAKEPVTIVTVCVDGKRLTSSHPADIAMIKNDGTTKRYVKKMVKKTYSENEKSESKVKPTPAGFVNNPGFFLV